MSKRFTTLTLAACMLILSAFMLSSSVKAQPFVDACFSSGAIGPSFASTTNIRNADSDLLNWTGSVWTGGWSGANITLAPPGSVAGTRAIWSGDGTVWTTGGEGFGLRLVSPVVTGTTYTFAFRRVSHGTGQNGSFAPIMYTNAGGTFGQSYGAIPAANTAWTNTNISFTAVAASNGHTFVYFHNNVGSGMFMGCTTAILPMAFWGLKAIQAGDAMQLTWQVQDEENYRWHVVDRSIDGLHFEEVGRVPSAQAGSEAHVYDYADAVQGLSAGDNVYYRIRSIDDEGREALSPVVAAHFGGRAAFEARIYPNPAAQNGNVQVEFFADAAGIANYAISDLQGRRLKSGNWSVDAQHNLQSLEIQGLPGGIYFLEIQTATRRSKAVLHLQ